jgi:acyl CoA:acetate/3-ketoacid CoA transferase beta subunit
MEPARTTEIMAVAGARELRDGEIVVVGLGLPQVACVLAKRTHAPRLTSLLEIGVVNMNPVDTPVGLADSRIFYGGTCWSGFLDVLGMNLHRGVVDVGFLGALELDRYGNINTTLLKEDSGRIRYFNGSAGGNDVASLAKRVIVILRHEKRKLPLAVAHLTSPGFAGGKRRAELGLRGGGPHRVITDMAVLGFDTQTCEATLLSVHPGSSAQKVQDHTGFPLRMPARVPETPLPTPEELRLLREEIDPRGVYLR